MLVLLIHFSVRSMNTSQYLVVNLWTSRQTILTYSQLNITTNIQLSYSNIHCHDQELTFKNSTCIHEIQISQN